MINRIKRGEGNSRLQLWGLCLLFAFASELAAAPADFPVPDNLKPAINFWVRVYTEIDTAHGFLHDPRNLDVVYSTLERDTGLIRQTREQLRDDLMVLASGKRNGLTTEQQRLLDLWPEGVSSETLETAAESIRWQLGQSDRFVAGLKRSGAYRKHIEDVVRTKGLPIELAALPHVESSFHPGAYSSAAATGMWQFVRATAQRFMQVDYVVDERLDPYEATYGAMDLLEFNFNALGTWPLALTAYNHGANGMARAVKDVGTTDIGRIVDEYRGRSFGFASRNFYAQFLAVLEVESREVEFYGAVPRDPRPDFDILELPDYIDARVLAESLGVDINDIMQSNPALQPSVWSGTKRIPRGYRIKLNRSLSNGNLMAAFNSIPVTDRFGEQIPDTSYTVSSGDSLSVIANRYSISVSELVAINQLRDRNRIRVGQNLLLPQQDGSIPALTVASAEPREIPDTGLYEVMRGDTLSVIATRFRLNEASLLAYNSLDNPDVLVPGQTLKLKAEARLPGEAPVLVARVENISPESVQLPGTSTTQVARNDTPGVLVSDTLQEPEVEVPAIIARNTEPDESRQVAVLDDSVIAVEGNELVIRDFLSIDTNNPALEVSEVVLAVEENQQLQSDLSTDPADYSVDDNESIVVQAAETLGHYAEWLDVRASDLRRLNSFAFRTPVIIGNRLKLTFEEVSADEFVRRRQDYHRDLQQTYFARWDISGTEHYLIRPGDVVSRLADARDVPYWLFRQYNPAVDSNRISIGQEVVFPIVQAVED